MVPTLLIPVVAGSPSTREGEMYLTGRRVTACVCEVRRHEEQAGP